MKIKFLQQDDIFDEQFKKQTQKYYFRDKIVRAINRKEAVDKLKLIYNINATIEEITNDFNQHLKKINNEIRNY